MTWQLLQHIYSGTRPSFETVAISPDMPNELVTALEARAQRYPERSKWGSEDPPFVVRGFRVPEAGEGAYAVSFLTYVGQCWDGSPGNYLAHSFVIPAGMVTEQGFNLPWIAASLSPKRHYEPICATGADRLAPISLALDPGHQFLLYAFIVREMERVGMATTTMRIVEHLSGNAGEPLYLPLPAPHPDLPRFFGEVFGSPRDLSPDLLRLYRLAGVFSVLPPAFKPSIGFSVNDDPVGQAYAIRVPREAEAATPAPAEWPWLEHLIALAIENRRQEFLDLCGWLRRLMPAGCKPSRRALDAGFGFYQSVVTARQPELDVMSIHMRAMAGCQVDVEVFRRAHPPGHL